MALSKTEFRIFFNFYDFFVCLRCDLFIYLPRLDKKDYKADNFPFINN